VNKLLILLLSVSAFSSFTKPGSDGFSGGTNENFQFEEGFYDLRRDPGERYDVKEYYPDVVTELKRLADEARIDLGDDILNVTGQNLRQPGRGSTK
jgi:arylsulfatase